MVEFNKEEKILNKKKGRVFKFYEAVLQKRISKDIANKELNKMLEAEVDPIIVEFTREALQRIADLER